MWGCGSGNDAVGIKLQGRSEGIGENVSLLGSGGASVVMRDGEGSCHSCGMYCGGGASR